MINLNNYDYFIFDFDGVILDSNSIKFKGFTYALKNEKKENLEKFLQFISDNPHKSRFEKFKYYFQKIKKVSFINDEFENALKKYSDYTINEVKKCKFVNGFEYFLDQINSMEQSIFIISATYLEDLKDILVNKKIIHKFDQILGSPNTKDHNFENIVNSLKNNNGLSFGDSKNDFLISKKNNLDFVFVNYNPDWKNFDNYKKRIDYIIKDFNKSNFIFSLYNQI